MNATLIGLLVGISLGFAAAFGGLGAFVLVLLFAVAGLVVGRVLDGQLDLTALLGQVQSRRDEFGARGGDRVR